MPAPAPAAMPREDRVVASSAVLEGTAQQGALLHGRVMPEAELTLDGIDVPVAPDGAFVVAFDRDAGPSATLVERRRTPAADLVATRTIPVLPRAWRIERLNRVARFPQPSAAFASRRPDELKRIVAARAMRSDVAGWRQRLVWPVSGRISGRFGSQRIYRGEPGSYHSGVDIARGTGTQVVAPADGVVVLAAAEPFTLEGRLLILDHGAGLNSAFLHLSRIDVLPGQHVAQGDRIGAVGATGRASGPHLHWSMMWRGRRIDPAQAAGPMPAGG